jgi:prolyl-tRNA synthetase
MAKDFVTRKENYSEWYNELVVRADLAENSSVRGCMVIKPYGYAIWEKMQHTLDTMFKQTGHQNAYFPLFIPKSFFEKEAEHVEGFAKECAVVTHHRLTKSPDGKGLIPDPEAELEEPLIVRPTSETIIWDTYKKWIKSYRDLPILINQWANVVRWEMRTRMFLRTAEFLWQEGHTAHETEQEAQQEALKMMNVYADFVEQYMAIPVVRGIKTPNERFAGAIETYCIEAMMQDGKALQAGTSHFLGQNFAKAFDVKFLSKENKLEYVWATSWGVSTRLMGALIMTHSDDNGLVLPPYLAPIEVVIIPIYKTEEEKNEIDTLAQTLTSTFSSKGISVKYDNDEKTKPGWKFNEYEFKGVPVRITLGARDLKEDKVEIFRRDTNEKEIIHKDDIVAKVDFLLKDIQENLFKKAQQMRSSKTRNVDTWEEFKVEIEKGGFLMCHWDGTSETEEKIKQETKATIRCIPLDAPEEEGKCVYSGKPSHRRVIFARNY